LPWLSLSFPPVKAIQTSSYQQGREHARIVIKETVDRAQGVCSPQNVAT
jgi:hypothetical protein